MGSNAVGVHETRRGPYIGTYTGFKFYPLDVRSTDIHIEDIAHALSMQCRFSGHVRRHYSVGQHSLLVSRFVKDNGGNVPCQLRALLHDASEAYLVDIPRPIKLIADFSVYRDIEKTTQSIIYEKFGLVKEHEVQDKLVKDGDNALLGREAEILMGNPFWCHSLPKAPYRILIMSPDEVEKKFLKKFNKLMKELHV